MKKLMMGFAIISLLGLVQGSAFGFEFNQIRCSSGGSDAVTIVKSPEVSEGWIAKVEGFGGFDQAYFPVSKVGFGASNDIWSFENEDLLLTIHREGGVFKGAVILGFEMKSTSLSCE
jgi:hypothetical protein